MGKGVGYTSDGINSGKIDTIIAETDKIDNVAIDGLDGVEGSLGYQSSALYAHTFSALQWYGKDGGDNLLNRASVTPWAVVAGTSQAYGSEVQLSDGTEIESGSAVKSYDLHRVMVTTNDATGATTFKLEFWYGTGLFATATLLTECVTVFNSALDNSGSIEIASPKIKCNNKLWVRVKSSVNSKSLSFILGVHTYDH